MNCPVCERSLAPTLSICPACGAMMHDSVREELQSKITPVAMPRIAERQQPSPVIEAIPERPLMVAMPIAKRAETANLTVSKTSPTLVGFQNKNASLPDWRLQLQNAVQQRKGGQNAVAATTTVERSFPTNGGAALKAEIVPPSVPEAPPTISDQRVANAMRRIDQSRQTFSEPVPVKKPPMAKPAPVRSFRFDVVAPNNRAAAAAAPARLPLTADAPPKPKLVVPAAEKRDTNKLPPLAPTIERVIKIEDPVEEKVITGPLDTEFGDIKRIRIRAEHQEVESETQEFDDEIEDLAPFSMRFGAGLFDLIISAFASAIVLAPFAFGGGNWSAGRGFLMFAATWAIVSFGYMTVCLGFFGKTMGMRLFSLELVDAVENEYPTLQQAAISSSIFLVSLPVCGAGFATAYFNEERRALHDLVSGTIIVREF